MTALAPFKFSIIVPIYNEDATILTVLQKLNTLKKYYQNIQIIVINDGSKDNSLEILENNKSLYDTLINNSTNKGKGNAVKKGLEVADGDYITFQDADLEYDPNDYQKLINPILAGKTKVVYGSRVLNKKRYSENSFTSLFRVFANHFLTIFSNILNNQNLTDAHTCYKVFHKEVLKDIKLKEKGFAFCPEITTKISNLNIDIHEVPISYSGRSYLDGKKIKFSDGIEAIKSIIKYKLNV